MQVFPLVLLSPVLIAAAWSELRRGEVPAVLGLAALSLFIVTMPFLAWAEITARAGLAACVFLMAYIALTRGFVSRGEVPLFGAMMLFVPSGAVGLYGLALALSMPLAGNLRIAPRTPHHPAHGAPDRPAVARRGIALGLPLAFSGLLLPVLAIAFGFAGLR